MAFNFNLAFEIPDDGLVLENGVHLISGSATPTHSVTNPTFYLKTDGSIYTNDAIGSGWVLMSSGSGSSFDPDKILTDNFFDVLIDNEGNVLIGV